MDPYGPCNLNERYPERGPLGILSTSALQEVANKLEVPARSRPSSLLCGRPRDLR